MNIDAGMSVVSTEEYIRLRDLRDNYDKIVADKNAQFEAAKARVEEKGEKIRWGNKSHLDVFRYYLGDGPIERDLYEYIGKDEAIARLTEKLNEAVKGKSKPDRASMGDRIKFLFTGSLE